MHIDDTSAVDGKHYCSDTDLLEWVTEDSPDANITKDLIPIAAPVATLSKGKVLETVQVLNKTPKKLLYKGEWINVKDGTSSITVGVNNIINCAENKKFYGVITWKRKAYTPAVRGYHSRERQMSSKASRDDKLLVGVEIEKEIEGIKERLSDSYLFDRYGWAAETDGSLNKHGYELVSPIYSLTKLSSLFKDLEALKEYIDGKPYTDNCGGHINVSSKEYSGDHMGKRILQEIRGFLPMLYAMYPERCEEGYSRARRFDMYIDDPNKRAFYPKRDRLEIRIFPEVSSVEELKNRLLLCRYMLQQSTKRVDVVIGRLLDPNKRLFKIVKAMGYDPKKLAQDMMDADARYDGTKYTRKVHAKLNTLGVKIKTKIKRTNKEKQEALKLLKTFVDENNDLSDVYADLRRQLEASLQ